MEIDIIQIGNSKGIRIPASILKQCKIKNKAEVKVIDNKIIIQAIDKPRLNWSSAFKEMHQNRDDELIINENLGVASEEW